MHWRRFKVSEIPLHNEEAFAEWLRQKWTEKDALLETWYGKGAFPDAKDDPIDTEVRLVTKWHIWQVFDVTVTAALLGSIFYRIWDGTYWKIVA